MKHTWTNSNGTVYNLNIIPPFYEEIARQEILATMDIPQPPGYWLEMALPNGQTKSEYFPHSDDTMTEMVFTDNATSLITGWKGARGETLRWQDVTTPNERRAWAGYKKKLADFEAKEHKNIAERIYGGTICMAIDVDIPDGWLADYVSRYGREPDNLKLAYIIDKVCVSESDHKELIIAINQIRNISKERVDFITKSFREAAQSNTTGTPAEISR
jgi:hypothetical protein